MSLTLKEVRVPTPERRASKILAALESNGPLAEYNVAGAISPNDGVAVLRTKIADQAMTLADGIVAGQSIAIRCIDLAIPGVDTVVVTPANLTGGTTITFNAVDDLIVLIWDIVPATDAWAVKPGNTAVVA